MTPGQLSVHGTTAGFLAFGLSSQHLWWTAPDGTGPRKRSKRRGRSEQRLMSGGDLCAALRCRSCGAITFRPAEVDDGWGSTEE